MKKVFVVLLLLSLLVLFVGCSKEKTSNDINVNDDSVEITTGDKTSQDKIEVKTSDDSDKVTDESNNGGSDVLTPPKFPALN